MDRHLARLGLFPDDDNRGNHAGLYVLEREFLVQGLPRTFSHEMLVGMDLISQCDFAVMRNGTASVDFS